jgi:hypothetical protein
MCSLTSLQVGLLTVESTRSSSVVLQLSQHEKYSGITGCFAEDKLALSSCGMFTMCIGAAISVVDVLSSSECKSVPMSVEAALLNPVCDVCR